MTYLLLLLRLSQQVHILVGDSDKAVIGKPHTQVFKLDEKLRSLLSSSTLNNLNRFSAIRRFTERTSQYCDLFLKNKNMMEEVKTANLIIGDFAHVCSSLVAAKFSLRQVVIVMAKLSTLSLIPLGVHNPPSYVPHPHSGLAGDQLTFLQRVQNTFIKISDYVIFHFLIYLIFLMKKSR